MRLKHPPFGLIFDPVQGMRDLATAIVQSYYISIWLPIFVGDRLQEQTLRGCTAGPLVNPVVRHSARTCCSLPTYIKSFRAMPGIPTVVCARLIDGDRLLLEGGC